MKAKAYGQFRKVSNGVLCKCRKRERRVEAENQLDNMPYVVLCSLASYLYGFDALAFGECVPVSVMSSDREFWRYLGR
jgi:hypothetical protein